MPQKLSSPERRLLFFFPRLTDEFSWLVFVENHKGDITLAISALVYLSSWVILRLSPWLVAGELIRSIGEAALVGGLCDYIALKMIFERRWYLPNSGVLPRNRQKLIDGISSVIENQWLTPQMIGAKLHELDLVKRLGRYLETVTIDAVLDHAHLERLCENLAGYLDSEPFRGFLEERIRLGAPRSIRIVNTIGLLSYHDISTRIGQHLHKAVAELPNDRELIKGLEDRLHFIGEELQQRDSSAREVAYRIMDKLVEHAINASKGQIAQTVKENLSRLSDDEIRFQIESRTRTHLDWIRVNGGIFGALFGAIFGIFNYLLGHGAAILQLIHP